MKFGVTLMEIVWKTGCFIEFYEFSRWKIPFNLLIERVIINIDRSFALQALAFRGEEVEPPRRTVCGTKCAGGSFRGDKHKALFAFLACLTYELEPLAPELDRSQLSLCFPSESSAFRSNPLLVQTKIHFPKYQALLTGVEKVESL
jgi:hypothetical protein